MKFGARWYFQKCVSRILFTGEGCGIPACIAGGIPACLVGLQAHTQGGSWGVWPGGSPGPHPGGSWGVWFGGLQAHTWGVSRLTRGGLQAHTWMGLQAHTQGGIPACTETDTPHPQQTATATGGTHPTGMHSCLILPQRHQCEKDYPLVESGQKYFNMFYTWGTLRHP